MNFFIQQVASKLGEEWRGMSDAEKAPFNDKYAKAKVAVIHFLFFYVIPMTKQAGTNLKGNIIN